MSKTLIEIAQELKDSPKKVQLIYAFNGTGKTRLSREFKELISPKTDIVGVQPFSELGQKKILYYSAFTEDLFYWNNDLALDTEHSLKIHSNSFTKWVLEEQGQDQNITATFQHYTNEKLTPHFNTDFSEVSFSFERGNDQHEPNIKISRGEESNFVWSVFNSLIELLISELNIVDVADRSTDVFNNLEYIFIDDPVSSLDENHLIELAVNLAALIKSSQSQVLKFIVSTHNPLFYNVIYNELKHKTCYMLKKFDDGTFDLVEAFGDSDKKFSYHLYLKETIEQAISDNNVQKYHFTLLRNLYEKTASFLGYPKWSDLLPDDKEAYLNRIIQFTSHSTLSNSVVSEPSDAEKNTVGLLLNHLVSNYGYWQQGATNG